ncbi:MAG TPA: SH3 domain-containing protein [Candidatus Avanaerovorax faecigallinarum]|nr:SH3 domain-containing protein [Candidatus Avanaerovorax faecigallinarum]
MVSSMEIKYNRVKIRIGVVIVSMFTMLLLSFFCADKAYGANADNASAQITSAVGANIRNSASINGSVVGAIPYNAGADVIFEKYTKKGSTDVTDIWYKVSSIYGNGYVRADLATLDYSGTTGKATTNVNVRVGPGTEYEKKGILTEGETVQVVLDVINADGESWNKVFYGDGYYYISAQYISGVNDIDGEEGDEEGDFEQLLAEFPDSYKAALTALHTEHSNWTFRAKKLDYTWQEALDAQCANVNANLVQNNFADSYKAVQCGTYDFTNHKYIGKDGANWVAASRQAVAYYMDPRNWLSEDYIFMFEPHIYDPSYQTKSLVSNILSGTALPNVDTNAASYYIEAANEYGISPVFLASKTRLELGTSAFCVDGHSFTYNGKNYSNCYNVYNIGAVDSSDGSAATKGLVYAVSGTSYGRPWNTLKKAVVGGASFIANDFVNNNQYTSYTERYNVYNGLGSVGTHQYMTSIFAATTEASISRNTFNTFGVLDEPFTFEIPVYQDMPSSAAKKPGAGNNNNYLDSLAVYDGTIQKALDKTFNRFATSYKLKTEVHSDVTSLDIVAKANASDAKISVGGNDNLKIGENTITIKVTSSSGLVRNYYITVVRSTGTPTEPAEPSAPEVPGNVEATRKSSTSIGITWTGCIGATNYQVYKSTTGKDKTFYLLSTVGADKRSLTHINLKTGSKYYYKVRAYKVVDGKKVYSEFSPVVSATATQ